MNYETAIRIVESVATRLSGGKDADFSYSRDEVLTALQLASTSIQHVRDTEQRRKALPGRAGERWTVSEDTEIKQAYLGGEDVGPIADRHKRTKGAIQSRLVKLGLISVDGSSDSIESSKSGSTNCPLTAEDFAIETEQELTDEPTGGIFRPPATATEIVGRVGGRIPKQFEARVESDRFGSRVDTKKLRSGNRSDLLSRINGRD